MSHTFVSGKKYGKLPTKPLNEAINASRDAEAFGARGGLLSGENQFLITVRNEEAVTDFERFAAVGLDEVLIDPDDNEHSFIGSVNLESRVPSDQHVSRFAITQQPIGHGMMGKALLYGITPAKVDIRSLQHEYAQPVDGDASLESVDFGGARIVWPTTLTSLGVQWCLVVLTGSGQAVTGERISGELETPLPSATQPANGQREPGVALMRVWKTDPNNLLVDQSRNRYVITGVTPTDPANLPAGQSFEIAIDVRFRLIKHYPIQVVESTSRDGTYIVESVIWDSVNGVCTIQTQNPIAEVLDINNTPVVDGTILIPGGARRIESDRYELVLNYGNRTAGRHTWCQATHDGAAYIVDHLDC